jgi:hypothetical protein
MMHLVETAMVMLIWHMDISGATLERIFGFIAFLSRGISLIWSSCRHRWRSKSLARGAHA